MSRRMFSDQIVRSDIFLNMPTSTRELYFQLNMDGDDDGFVKNPYSVMRIVGASKDDMDILIAKRFILVFENGVIVIKHWRIHNYIRIDRYKPTVYQNELAMLDMRENKAYSLKELPHDLFTNEFDKNKNGTPMVYQRLTQVKLSKVKLSEVKKDNKEDAPKKHQHGSLKNVLLTNQELVTLKNLFKDYSERIENLSMYMGSTGKIYKSHYLTILNWDRRDKKKEDKDGKSSISTEKFEYIPRRDRQSSEDKTSDS